MSGKRIDYSFEIGDIVKIVAITWSYDNKYLEKVGKITHRKTSDTDESYAYYTLDISKDNPWSGNCLKLISRNITVNTEEFAYQDIYIDNIASIKVTFNKTNKSIIVNPPTWLDKLKGFSWKDKIRKVENKLKGNYDELYNILNYKKAESKVRSEIIL